MDSTEQRVARLPNDVVAAVAYKFGATADDIRGVGRAKNVVAARCVVSYVLRQWGMSLPSIGRVLKKDHSSIIHYLEARIDTYLKHPKYGPLTAELSDWATNGSGALREFREHAAKENSCNIKLQTVTKRPQQRRSAEMPNPETTEKQIAEALKAEKLRGIEVIWNGDIVCREEPAVFNIYRNDDETNLFVRDDGSLFTLHSIENRCTYEVGCVNSCAKLATLLREALNTKEAA